MLFPTLDKDQRRILQMLRKSGPLSRSALASALEISGTALTRLSRDLIGLNLVEEVPGAEAQGRGRPAIPLRLAGHGGYAVGATAHKGFIDIALVDFTGATIATHGTPHAGLGRRGAGTIPVAGRRSVERRRRPAQLEGRAPARHIVRRNGLAAVDRE